jgi:hypothetical protein
MSDTDEPDAVDAELVPDPSPSGLPAAGGPPIPEPDYSEGGVPSFDFVRDTIEKRFTTASGATELAGLGGKEDIASLDRKLADRDKAARDRLAEIRKAMRGE